MKKMLTLAIALIAIVSQAASIDWKVSFLANTIKEVKDDSLVGMTGTAYLILSGDLTKIDDSVSDDLSTFTSKLDDLALASVAISGGKFANGTATDKDITTGSNSFQFIIFDSVNKMYYESAIKTGTGYVIGETEAETITFTATNIGATAATKENGKNGTAKLAVIVPEPATGALALAGIALLFRRKRA